MSNRWWMIGWLYLVGVMAAAQLGKMSALVPLISLEMALSLTAAALAISLLEAGGATLGAVAGAAIHRIGRRRALLGGLALLGMAGMGEGLAGSAAMLLGWRVVESLGYLAIVIAAPLLIIQAAGLAGRGPALALWSSFVPVGIALGAVLSGAAAEWVSWRATLVSGGVLALVVLAVTATLPIARAGARFASDRHTRPGRAAWMLALGFGCYALFEVGMLGLLPIFLVRQAGATTSSAALLTGIASFVTVLGSIVAAWWTHGGRGDRMAMSVTILAPAAMLFWVFHDGPDLMQVATAAIVLNAISGVFPGLAFAMLPKVAVTDAQMAMANGLFTQCGAAGSLIEPPLFAASTTAWGWLGAAVAGAGASVVCCLAMFVATMAAPSPAARTDLVEDHR